MTRVCFSAIAGARRIVPGIALAFVLIAGVQGRPTPAFADNHDDSPLGPRPIVGVDATTAPVEPAARLQVVVRTVDVSNDRDGFWTGAGDILLTTNIWRCTGAPPPCSASENNQAQLLAEDEKSFNADSGDAVSLNRVIPMADDVQNSTFASEEGGIAVFDGQSYLLQFSAFERDAAGGDFMGGVQRVINASNGWGVGTYTREPAGHVPDPSLPNRGILCAGCGDIIVGDYLVTYEIRLASLPDMHPKSMRVQSAGGPEAQVCATIENLGSEPAEAYGMIFVVDGDSTSRISGLLAVNQSQEQCIPVEPLAIGSHSLSVTVDPDRAIPEANERNNVLTQSYVRRITDDIVAPVTGGVLDTGGSSGPSQPPVVGVLSPEKIDEPNPTGPVLTAPGPRANLQVTTIRVRGKDPSGQDDCDPGDNDVTVVLKNLGNAPAVNFAIRLVVDAKENDALEKPVATLNPGQELSVMFGGVQLNSDDHRLLATVDARKSVDESDETNNELQVKVACKSERD